MKKANLCVIIALLFVFNYTSCNSPDHVAEVKTEKNKLRRSESFFGLHFDFHATNNDSLIGETLSYEMIDSMLALVKPDYIQVDCKGHPGISSYPTKVGNPSPGFVKDPFKIWRNVTEKHGVALYVHYSGVWDDESATHHPGWVAETSTGQKTNRMSVKGPYVDSLLLPQLKELIGNYKIDGCWIDGECWALSPDYSKNMLDAFREETGITNIPRNSEDKGWYEWMEFNRKSFRQYLRHYTNELHSYSPDFQVTSNWAFSSLMPEPVDVDIDFISGDFSHVNSVYSGLYEARCIAPQGEPWDLMSWSFAYNFETGVQIPKSAVQLNQLAATVLSMGGGYQVYFTQNRDASVRPWLFNVMKEVAGFCRERQPYCQGSIPVPQIALLYSTENHKRNSPGLYYRSSKINNPIDGMLRMLLDGQNAVEIQMEHHLKGRMNEYPLIIVPECEYMGDDFKNELLQYVSDGGRLLLVGASSVNLCLDELHVEKEKEAYMITQNISNNDQMAGIHTLFQPVVPGKDAEVCGLIYEALDFRSPSKPAATIANYGKGKIAGIYFNIGQNYLQASNPVYRNYINSIVHKLFPDPIVEISGSDNVVTAVNSLGGQLAVHLINMSGEHGNEKVARYDHIPPTGPLQLKLRLPVKPDQLILQPGNKALKCNYANGIAEVNIDRIDIYNILMIK